ncbi:MAG: deoxyhypusine synthase [Bdellovibrio sp. CG12_big_fil_rev_8_21_14_0_65_39_13]|nr:MAG: deoxyhypusine synthase [Bdellovibrio sp. CG22_combo_CG10-13_8_21_14_all_39_27]PIQ62620.1 MAG: deoxyhypusine synthase [Bdellovibrio sp. CG12_big_fil_rev_8_21_14_0_65_39_13]PIR36975.1 MAG: deoxyhypusine synthase [Bdellovibrio sp. CG11_big_fil_rev_8_21_14_0_20_39_38]PJB53852.1 MAG: deoxyhypusine synthase [Bdellovibrio sp. CG_4_9_14_3_um_filter_39_7]
MTQPIRDFMERHYKHFNAAALVDAAKGYETHINSGKKMLITLAGAMSTAELGKSLAEMIRQDKVHAICCTGANLEEDVYNLIAHNDYARVPNYRDLTPQEEVALFDRGMNRVTDTCIPEDVAMRKIEALMWEEWAAADSKGETNPPHVYFWNLLRSGVLEKEYQIDPKDSWMHAAMLKNIPIFTPGWEDSTLGNMFAAANINKKVSRTSVVESGIQLMIRLSHWYKDTTVDNTIGFFQIGGGIAGDFPICVVPMLHQDLELDVPLWSFFCQISDSTTSYGSYSGAVPNEKITWGKLAIETPKFIIESDATIVAPLLFAYVLKM